MGDEGEPGRPRFRMAITPIDDGGGTGGGAGVGIHDTYLQE